MKGLLQTLTTEWRSRSSTVICETAGTAASVLAAVLLSFQITGLIPVYVCWLAGSLLLTVSSWQRQNINLMTLMMFYTVMNLIGLGNYS